MALLVGSILVVALHALVVSTARMTRRAEIAQQTLREDMAAQRMLRRQGCGPSSSGFENSLDLRLTRRDPPVVEGHAPAPALLTVERREGEAWRVVATASERCVLRERCEWDLVARSCRETATTP